MAVTPLTNAVPIAVPMSTNTAPTNHRPLLSTPLAVQDHAPVNAAVVTGTTTHTGRCFVAATHTMTRQRTQPTTCHASYGPLVSPVAGSTR